MAKIDTIHREQGRRLRAFREAAGFKSARRAAHDNGWPESTYRAHEAGTRTIGQDDAEKYAARFKALSMLRGISAQAILFGAKAADQGADIVQVPLISWVTAGRLAEPTSQVPTEDVPMLAFADLGPGSFFALRVVGGSMNRISPDSSTIVINRDDRQLVTGKAYIFSLSGETSYKIWQPEPARFEPLTTEEGHRTYYVKRKRDLEIIGRVRRTILDL